MHCTPNPGTAFPVSYCGRHMVRSQMHVVDRPADGIAYHPWQCSRCRRALDREQSRSQLVGSSLRALSSKVAQLEQDNKRLRAIAADYAERLDLIGATDELAELELELAELGREQQ